MRHRIFTRASLLRAAVAALPCVAAALLAGAAGAAGPAAPVTVEAVWLQSNLRELYPSRAEICLSTYQQMSDEPGVVLVLQTDVENFSHYRYSLQRDSLPREERLESRSGEISVRFERHDVRPQRIKLAIQAVSKSGRKTRPYSIELGYYPTEHYAAAGQRTPSWLVVHDSDVELCGSSVEDWIVERPSAQDRAYAKKRWARLVDPLPTDYDKARAIARDLVESLRGHEGIPSDRMRYAPAFEQLARAEGGRDRVWCGNYADIFSAACNALGIPARKIDMQYVWSSQGRTSFEIAEGHRTTEVFDRQLNRWVWMDLTLRCWGARMDGDEPLNMAELVDALNDERRVGRLRLFEYDDQRGLERIVPVAESGRGKDLFRFFRQDQRYQYHRKSLAAAP
jgi:transglutaminase-like putative cysteine protease